MKIKNIDDLRDVVLDTIQKLQERKIDVTDAGVLAKLSETVISGIKIQLEYCRLSEQKPDIPFLGDHDVKEKLIEVKQPKLLTRGK